MTTPESTESLVLPKTSMSGHQRPHRGETDVWLTPPEIVEATGPFDLDPCSPIDRPWPTAAKHYTIEDDGLSKRWDGFVWCNPPFGPDAGWWLDRMVAHHHGIALVAARTETQWFIRTVWHDADGVLFLHGRPHFHHADGARAKANSGAPICLVAYGSLAVERLRSSGLTGSFASGWEQVA